MKLENKKNFRYISYRGELIAIFIRNEFSKDGVKFFTPKELSQQVGYMQYPAGHHITAHFHRLHLRKVYFTEETILVKSGKIRVNLYSKAKKKIKSLLLTKGDILLLVSGGHSFDFLKQSELIEIKQGPYVSDVMDKEVFT